MDTHGTNAPARRKFLLAVGAGSVAAAAAVVTGGSPSAQHTSAKNKSGSRGYQLTEHVRNYYRTTQI
jgi:hypothetical protein